VDVQICHITSPVLSDEPVAIARAQADPVVHVDAEATPPVRREETGVEGHALSVDQDLDDADILVGSVEASISGDRDLEAALPLRREECKVENPVMEMDVMQLKPVDFHNCRTTEDGLIVVYDGIQKFDGCSMNRARQRFDRIRETTKCIFIKFHQFPRSDGRLGRTVPCCTFLNLLKLLAMLPGAQASLLRQNMAEITARAIAGDISLVADVVAASDRSNRTTTMATLTVADTRSFCVTYTKKLRISTAQSSDEPRA
jgi:hypothetical protein